MLCPSCHASLHREKKIREEHLEKEKRISEYFSVLRRSTNKKLPNLSKKEEGRVLMRKTPLASNEPPLRIMLTVIYANRPLTMTEIASKGNLPRQLVAYHLPRLIGDHLLLPIEPPQGRRNILYAPQPFLADERIFKKIVKLIEPVIDAVSENLLILNKDEAEKALRNNMYILLNLLQRETQRKV